MTTSVEWSSMNISSAVLRVRPERLAQARAALAGMPGVELHAATDDGRLIVTIEDSAVASAADTYVALHNVDGVLSAYMVYQYCDENGVAQESGR